MFLSTSYPFYNNSSAFFALVFKYLMKLRLIDLVYNKEINILNNTVPSCQKFQKHG